MEHIYILRLRAGKYYIGKTKNVDKRWAEHTSGCGSGWTKKYPPVSLVKSVVSTSQFDEDRYVKEYMGKYGIENVRGGTYSNVVLDANCIAVLEKEIRHSKNLCVRCGRDTHFVKDCYATTDSDGAVIKEAAKDTVKNAKQDVKKPYVYKATAKNSKKSSYDNNSCDSNSDDDYGDDSWKGKKSKAVLKKYVKPCDICGIKGHREVNCYEYDRRNA
uniref:GIY-YIG domain-containing protein n=1 Tax=viral metagenome TaxID=1070528 RepID=A0A6C0KBF2_9ZZZZ